MNELQQDGLCGGEVRSALFQSGQSEQTVCLTVEGDTKALIHVCIEFQSTQRSELIFKPGTMLLYVEHKIYLLDETASATI